MEKDKPLTYQAFLRMQLDAEKKNNAKKQDEKEVEEEEFKITQIIEIHKGEEEPEEIKQQQTQNPAQNIEKPSFLTNLCRVCGSPGNISLHILPPEAPIYIKATPQSRKNRVTIAQMITDISGEIVETTDLLPQFICSYCLGYLQHAHNIRNQIIETSKNFTFVKEIQAEEGQIPLQLSPTSQLPSVSQNQREIIEHKEDLERDSYWNDAIEVKTTKIKLKVKAPAKEKARNERLFEHKCANCNKRVYSIKALNQHTAVCVITHLATFFSQFQQLYSDRIAFKISSIEYQINALSLIYNTNKTLRKIAKEQKFNVDALQQDTSIYEPQKSSAIVSEAAYRRSNRFTSPDIGYNSGYTS